MQSELDGFLKNCKFEMRFDDGFDYYYTKQTPDKEIFLVKTEVGKVHAAIVTTTFIQKIKPNYVLNAGIAGSLHEKIPPLTTIYATKTAYFDVDLTPFGCKLGQLENLDLYFKTSKDFYKKIDVNDYQGLIVSSDTFVSTVEQKNHILKYFPKALACDMEGASICQVAHFFRRKFMVIRTISDVVGTDHHVDNYHDYKEEAIQMVVKKTLRCLETL